MENADEVSRCWKAALDETEVCAQYELEELDNLAGELGKVRPGETHQLQASPACKPSQVAISLKNLFSFLLSYQTAGIWFMLFNDSQV